jgi:hypothetical protein
MVWFPDQKRILFSRYDPQNLTRKSYVIYTWIGYIVGTHEYKDWYVNFGWKHLVDKAFFFFLFPVGFCAEWNILEEKHEDTIKFSSYFFWCAWMVHIVTYT